MSETHTTVITADGEVQTNEEATVHVNDLELFVTVQVIEDAPPIQSLGKLCENHGYSRERIGGQKPHLMTTAERNHETRKLRARRATGLVNTVLQI